MGTLYKAVSILTKKERIIFIILGILMFIGGLFDLFGISLVIPVMNLAINPDSILDNKYCSWLFYHMGLRDARIIIIVLLVAMITIYIIKNVYILFMYKVLYHYTYAFKKRLSMKLMRFYMYQNYTFHLNNNVADLQRNILTDTGQFYGFISDCMNLFNQSIVCILLGIFLFLTDWRTSIGVAVILGGGMLVVYRYQKKKQVKLGAANRESSAELNKWIIQSFSGIKEIQVLGREEFFLQKFETVYDKGMNANKKSNYAALVPKPLMEMLCVGGLLGLVLLRILLGSDITSFISILAVFAVASFRMLPCFNSISAYVSNMLFEKEAVDAVADNLSMMSEYGEKSCKKTNSKRVLLNSEIRGENISYHYPGSSASVLNGASFLIKKNQSVGIIGESGAGKSTLVDIILGVLPLSVGKITVDGIDIKNNMNEWHKAIGYIPQSIYLLDDTIRRNVAFGIPDKDICDEQIWRALEEAQISDFVKQLENGLDSEIGDRGVRISGGQRQRLGIARALYNNPQILVFDEATSALDNDTEAALMSAINKMQGNRTMVIIAHRLNTIEQCDIIYKVNAGEIVKVK